MRLGFAPRGESSPNGLRTPLFGMGSLAQGSNSFAQISNPAAVGMITSLAPRFASLVAELPLKFNSPLQSKPTATSLTNRAELSHSQRQLVIGGRRARGYLGATAAAMVAAYH